MKNFFAKKRIALSFLCLMSATNALCQNYYEVLGLAQGASRAAIIKAYRQLVKTKHPDHGGSQAEFAEISNAHDILKDKELKKVYDNSLFLGHDAAARMVNQKVKEQSVQRQRETLIDEAKSEWQRERGATLVQLAQKAERERAEKAEPLYRGYLTLLHQYVDPVIIGNTVDLKVEVGFKSNDPFEVDQFAGQVLNIYIKMIKKYLDEQKYTQANRIIEEAKSQINKLQNMLNRVAEDKITQTSLADQIEAFNALLATKPEEAKTEQEKAMALIKRTKTEHKAKLKRARDFAKEKNYRRAEQALRVYLNNFPKFDTENRALLVLQATQFLQLFDEMSNLYGLINADDPQRALTIINEGLASVERLEKMLQKYAPLQERKPFAHQVHSLKSGKGTYESVLRGEYEEMDRPIRFQKALANFSQSLQNLAHQLQS